MKRLTRRCPRLLLSAVVAATALCTVSPASAATTPTFTLNFAAHRGPADAGARQAITSENYFPTSPLGVQVEIRNNTGKLANLADRIRLTVVSTGQQLGPDQPATNGVATFDPLLPAPPLTQVGLYELQATALTKALAVDDRVLPVRSAPFRIANDALSCLATTRATCPSSSSSNSGHPTKVDVSAPTAGKPRIFAASSFADGPAVDCQAPEFGGYFPLTPPGDTALVDSDTAGAETVTITVDKFFMQTSWLTGLPLTNNGASFIQFCFGAPKPFAVRSGGDGNGQALQQGTFAWKADQPPAPVYVGTLPDCPAPGPCVLSRNKAGSGAGVITASVPADFNDPKGRS